MNDLHQGVRGSEWKSANTYEAKQVKTDWENNSRSPRTQEVRQVGLETTQLVSRKNERGAISVGLKIPTSNTSIVSDQ